LIIGHWIFSLRKLASAQIRNIRDRLITRSGFTLIEVLTTGALAAFLGAIMLTVISLHNREIGDGQTHALLQMRSEMVAGQLSRSIHKASLILAPSEDTAAYGGVTPLTTNEIRLWDTTRSPKSRIGGFLLSGSVLYQWNPDSAAWRAVAIGTDTILFAPGAFVLPDPSRKLVAIQLRTRNISAGRADTLALRGGMYRCRN